MAMTKWSTGTISGWVYSLLGENYQTFFTFVLFASIPPVIFAFIAPFPRHDDEPNLPAAGGH